MGEKEPKTSKDFVNLARKSDRVRAIREAKGSHVIIEFDDSSSISVPVYGNKQLSKGIHQKLLKTFKSAGILE